jgi:sensor histidine kinase YesM
MQFEPYLFLWQCMVTALGFLCIISLVIGYNSGEKSFLFYAVYTFFMLFYFILISPYDLIWRDQLFTSPFESLRFYSQVIYNCSYFLFFLYFLDVKIQLYTFYSFIIKVVGIIFTAGTIVFLYGILSGKPEVFNFFYIYIFVPILFCFAVYTLIRTFALDGKLKYFFIIGGGTFIILAMMALFLPIMDLHFFNFEGFHLFYIGIFIEQFVFSLGLAYKVKMINQALLDKSLENQYIKENQNRMLEIMLKEKEDKLLAITAKAEEDRVARLRAKFEDQIHHLHLVSLQSQMNPHFIFNALNSIKVFLIENDKQQAIYYLNKFSKLIRDILESARVESINLAEELKILELYVNIENIRFEDQIIFSVENPERINLKNIDVPSMILQPFIENAIWHGLMLKKGKKRIVITFFKQHGVTAMKIIDNGIGRQKSTELRVKKTYQKESIGLKIVSERLNYFNQKQQINYYFTIHDLKNEKGEPTGTEIEVFFSSECL